MKESIQAWKLTDADAYASRQLQGNLFAATFDFLNHVYVIEGILRNQKDSEVRSLLVDPVARLLRQGTEAIALFDPAQKKASLADFLLSEPRLKKARSQVEAELEALESSPYSPASLSEALLALHLHAVTATAAQIHLAMGDSPQNPVACQEESILNLARGSAIALHFLQGGYASITPPETFSPELSLEKTFEILLQQPGLDPFLHTGWRTNTKYQEDLRNRQAQYREVMEQQKELMARFGISEGEDWKETHLEMPDFTSEREELQWNQFAARLTSATWDAHRNLLLGKKTEAIEKVAQVAALCIHASLLENRFPTKEQMFTDFSQRLQSAPNLPEDSNKNLTRSILNLSYMVNQNQRNFPESRFYYSDSTLVPLLQQAMTIVKNFGHLLLEKKTPRKQQKRLAQQKIEEGAAAMERTGATPPTPIPTLKTVKKKRDQSH